ncbi:MAG: hypothetical protein ACTSR8_00295 [Promethearchaeota archaeon]
MGYLPYDVGLKTTFWVIVLCYIAIVATLFVLKSMRTSKEIPSQRAMFRAIGLFFYLVILARIFFILSDYERDPHGETDLYFQFVAASYICSIIGFLFIIIIGEKYIIKPGKFFMTFIIIGFLIFNVIILIFFPGLFTIARYINYGLLYTEVILITLIFGYLVSKTSGDLRKNALLSLIGMCVMATASFLESDVLISSGIVQPYYSPVLFAIGISLFGYAQMKGL